MGGKITTQMTSSSKPQYATYRPNNLSPVRSVETLLIVKQTLGVFPEPLRKGLISDARVAIDRELEDILRAHSESEFTLSDNSLFYIVGYGVGSLSGSVKCDECINQLIGEPGAGVDH